MKRGYFVRLSDEFWGLCVVATSAKEAKKMAFATGDLDTVWIDIRVKWERAAVVEELPIGVVYDMRQGLLCGICRFIEGYCCDECGVESTLELCSGKALCFDCIEKEYEKEGKNGEGNERKEVKT